MEEHRSLITLSCVVGYLAVCIGVGLWAMRRTQSSRDFFVAGRSLGVWVTSIAIFSSTLSGFAFVGGPGLTYRQGMTSVWMILTAACGYAAAFALLAKPLRLIAELRDTLSLPDAVGARYRSPSAQLLMGLAILLGVMGYLGTQILAMATVMQGILGDVAWIGELDLVTCVVISCAILIFYCVTGGIIASVYTDVLQGAMMVGAAFLIVLAARSAVDGGFTGMSLTLMQDDPEVIGPWGSLGILASLSFFFIFAVGTAGQPQVITKLMMFRRVSDAKLILPITTLGYTAAALLWLVVGLAMRALVLQGTHPELPSADAASPLFLQTFAHPLLAGVVFAGLLAAIMSTADAFLNIGAAVVVRDVPRALFGRALRNELSAARWATVGVGLLAAGFALYSHYYNARLIALLGVFGAATFAAAIIPPVLIGFNWKRATALAANVAMATSIGINLAVEIFDLRLPYAIHGGVPAMLVSTALFLAISLASKPPTIDPDIEAAMDL
ncbi:hypothetical protein MK489_24125 [Myxococcota bacterium]|nr:hypothetical protein [Myxococcota bacterium]